MKKVHKELDLMPLNARINRLTNMANNVIKNLYLPPKNYKRNICYKHSDFTITILQSEKEEKTL